MTIIQWLSSAPPFPLPPPAPAPAAPQFVSSCPPTPLPASAFPPKKPWKRGVPALIPPGPGSSVSAPEDCTVKGQGEAAADEVDVDSN